MASANQVSITFVSKLKKTVKVVLYVISTIVDPDNAIIKGIIALMEVILQAKATQVALAINKSNTATAGTTAYSSAEDRLLFSSLLSNDKDANFQIPGPKVADFYDGEDIDPANAAVLAFSTSLVTYASGQDGVTNHTGDFAGHRIERKRIKK